MVLVVDTSFKFVHTWKVLSILSFHFIFFFLLLFYIFFQLYMRDYYIIVNTINFWSFCTSRVYKIKYGAKKVFLFYGHKICKNSHHYWRFLYFVFIKSASIHIISKCFCWCLLWFTLCYDRLSCIFNLKFNILNQYIHSGYALV